MSSKVVEPSEYRLPQPTKGLKVLRLAASNVKKIVAFDYSPGEDESLIQITGGNGEGKTTVLDCILYALGGLDTIPSQPIRRGQHNGQIQIDFGEFTVRRLFSMAEGPSLEIKSKAGTVMSKTPQGFLNSLMDKISFDPLAFTRQSPKEQAQTLRDKVQLAIDPDALDAANKVDYDERRKLNTQIKEMDITLAAYHPVGDLPEQPIDLDELDAALERAGVQNARIEAQQAQKKMLDQRAARAFEDAQAQTREIEGLRARLEKMQAALLESIAEASDLAALAQKYEIDAPADTSDLREQMKNARAANRAIEERQRASAIQAKRDEFYAHAVLLTDRMAARDEEKRAAVEAAEMPIAGLSFESGEVYYNGFPFSQASGAEQLRISMAIAMSGRKQLRVIRIVDGSLLDDKSLELVKDLARKNDYQVWIEMVDTTGEVGIVIAEGKVESTPASRALSGPPAAPPASAGKETRGRKAGK